jgi:CubicO group peptidase (beta-lactamase class C family)
MIKKIFIFLVSIVSISIFIVLSGCENRTGASSKLNEFMKSYNDYCSYKYSGVILVAKGDEILLSEGYGMANYEKNIPNDPNSVFAIGSITKSFTGIAIMQLQEEGLLNVEDPISKYIEHYRGDDITLHHLLTHTSGLQREGEYKGQQDVTLEQHIEYINKCAMLFEPGESYSYSNAGYQLLAAIIEEASGISYTEYINNKIFIPLDMRQSRVGVDASYTDNQAIGYSLIRDTPMKLSIYNFSNIIGSGNIYSTINDLYKYERGIYNEQLVSKASLEQIFEHGYGWEESERYNYVKISHGGNIGGGGYNSLMVKFPEEEYVLIFLTNNSDVTALQAVSEMMEAIIFEKDYVTPVPIKKTEIDAEILKQYAGDYDFPEGFVLSVTYRNNKIYSDADDGNTYELLPVNETTFYFQDHQCVKVEFDIDSKSNEVSLKLYNRTYLYEGQK